MKFAGSVFFVYLLIVISTQFGCAGGAVQPSANSATPQSNSIQITTSQLSAGNVGTAYSAPLATSGGHAPLHWSLASGSLPSGLALSAQSGTISGVPTGKGTSSFTAWVTDAMGASAKTNLSISVETGTQAAGSNTAIFGGKYYGPALGSDALANTTVGPDGNTVSYRFRVQHSGVLQQATIYLIPDHAGYAGGNGGSTLINLTTDDGSAAHNPTSTVLASYTMSDVLSLPSPDRYFYVLKFANPPALTGGQLYHMTFTNVDANPSVNFLSVDTLYEYSEPTPSQPTISDIDSAVLLGTNGKHWSRRKGMTPIYELDFTDGFSEGIGYMEVWSGAPMPISGSNAVRETFTVSGSQVNVNAVSLRLARVNGSDPLTVRLENADGSLIEQGTVPAEALPLSSSSSPNYEWVTYTFNSKYSLVPGQTYHLDFESSATSTYQAFPIRKGSSYGFKDTTYFPDGHAEVDANGSWTGWTQWGTGNRLDSDLQFYFNVVP